MYICICEGLTDKDLKKAIDEDDIQSCRQLKACLGAGGQCGKCNPELRALFQCPREAGQAVAA